MDAISIPVHFDGKQILLDEPIELEPSARLIVTVLPADEAERRDWFELSARNLAEAYSDDEPDYPLDSIQEANLDYEGSEGR